MMGCHISSNGLAALLQGLEQSTCADKLRKLDLNDCHIGTEGAKVLGLAIGRASLPSLEKLDISDNACIGCDGVTSLVQGLQTASRTRLISLYMHSIGMGDAGLKSLADAIRCGVLADCLQIDVSGNDFVIHSFSVVQPLLSLVHQSVLTLFAIAKV
jgi:Ran GTPase-activating protein (RanGAP) involved in mRNA processing and transport